MSHTIKIYISLIVAHGIFCIQFCKIKKNKQEEKKNLGKRARKSYQKKKFNLNKFLNNNAGKEMKCTLIKLKLLTLLRF